MGFLCFIVTPLIEERKKFEYRVFQLSTKKSPHSHFFSSEFFLMGSRSGPLNVTLQFGGHIELFDVTLIAEQFRPLYLIYCENAGTLTWKNMCGNDNQGLHVFCFGMGKDIGIIRETAP